ncbi:MAG: ribonuclease III [Firmicutes bacterium]|nr:ribonuclease III [Bacillota bacterium]
MNSDVRELEKIIGYEFKDAGLLEQAVTHSSRANELTGRPSDGNERLEFLGDAVLEEIMSTRLFKSLPGWSEGRLSKLRAAIVCEKSLSDAAKALNINDFIRLGRGEELTGGRDRDSIVSDCLEAIFGAVFLDGGHGAACRVIDRILSSTVEKGMEGKLAKDAKSELQELLQARGVKGCDIEYVIVGESGPDHDKLFEAAVLAAGQELGRGCGRSKQSAQAAAAAAALKGESCAHRGK